MKWVLAIFIALLGAGAFVLVGGFFFFGGPAEIGSPGQRVGKLCQGSNIVDEAKLTGAYHTGGKDNGCVLVGEVAANRVVGVVNAAKAEGYVEIPYVEKPPLMDKMLKDEGQRFFGPTRCEGLKSLKWQDVQDDQVIAQSRTIHVCTDGGVFYWYQPT